MQTFVNKSLGRLYTLRLVQQKKTACDFKIATKNCTLYHFLLFVRNEHFREEIFPFKMYMLNLKYCLTNSSVLSS